MSSNINPLDFYIQTNPIRSGDLKPIDDIRREKKERKQIAAAEKRRIYNEEQRLVQKAWVDKKKLESAVQSVTIFVDIELLAKLDTYIREEQLQNRSMAFHVALKNYLNNNNKNIEE